MCAIHVSMRVVPVHGALSHGDHGNSTAPIKVLHNNNNRSETTTGNFQIEYLTDNKTTHTFIKLILISSTGLFSSRQMAWDFLEKLGAHFHSPSPKFSLQSFLCMCLKYTHINLQQKNKACLFATHGPCSWRQKTKHVFLLHTDLVVDDRKQTMSFCYTRTL